LAAAEELEAPVTASLPYCGTPPLPGTLLERFNLDPVLIVVLIAAAAWHLTRLRGDPSRWRALCAWTSVAIALVSPLCALSVALFSARVGQHMLLLLTAAPLLGLTLPAPRLRHRRMEIWVTSLFLMLALWFWHMPAPYQATFESTSAYWLMHVTLFGSGVWFWRALLGSGRAHTADALVAAAMTSMQIGLLGAVLAMASHPLFFNHFTTTQVWGLTPLADQQLGGVIMWVPGIALFLWATLRGLSTLRQPGRRARATHDLADVAGRRTLAGRPLPAQGLRADTTASGYSYF
jgi:putative membrane protein